MRFLAAALAAMIFMHCRASAQVVQSEWTVMVYLNADNNLELFGLKDFREMAEVGSSDQMNVVVQMDRTPGFATTTPDWTQTLRFLVRKGQSPLLQYAVADIGEQNMGDGPVLTDFVSWAMRTYPAKKYMLIIWDHGDGWRLLNTLSINLPPSSQQNVRTYRQNQATASQLESKEQKVGVLPADRVVPSPVRAASHDDSSGDFLYNRETADALRKVLAGKKLDVLAFDACLMGGIESAYAFRDVAKVFIASEELEPGDGWDYSDWLKSLREKPSIDASELGKLAVESYKTQYAATDGSTTLSAIDQSKIGAAAVSVSATASAILADLNANIFPVVTARKACKEYAPGYGLHNIDWLCFARGLVASSASAAVKAAAQNSILAVQSAVLANYAGPERTVGYGSEGLSIYFPASEALSEQDPERTAYVKGSQVPFPVEFVQQHEWSAFLSKYFEKVRR